jgi:polysaccharide pyruvyl transferase WcaK-like protein
MIPASESNSCRPPSATGIRPRIILRSSWQTVNIGDIGHTPGMLRLLERHLPEAELSLWACDLGHGVDQMLARDFPRVNIFTGPRAEDGAPECAEGRKLWEEADLLIHGSGPYVVTRRTVDDWAATGRPYGIYGVTLENFDESLVGMLTNAAFVFCRDSVSLRAARAAGVRCPRLEFAPDAAFAADDRDDESADRFLQANGLADGEFISVISRLRYTPYFKIRNLPPTPQEIERHELSESFKESDHERLRKVIIAWVRATGQKVLLCPEMTYEIELTKEQLIDPMPDDVKPFLVWRDTYWRPDEATSVYAHSFAVVSMEMHSPILACAVNTPAFYLRLPTDTCKGQMWRDIGLPEWIYEVEESDGDEIAEGLLRLLEEPARTMEKMRHARARVAHLQAHSMAVVRDVAMEAAVRLS